MIMQSCFFLSGKSELNQSIHKIHSHTSPNLCTSTTSPTHALRRANTSTAATRRMSFTQHLFSNFIRLLNHILTLYYTLTNLYLMMIMTATSFHSALSASFLYVGIKFLLAILALSALSMSFRFAQHGTDEVMQEEVML